MAMVILSQIISIALVAQSACAFPSIRRTWPRPLSAVHAEIESSNDGGAGSWRSKAKEFQNRPKELDRDEKSHKRLNIAFVVSYILVEYHSIFANTSLIDNDIVNHHFT